MDHKRKGKAKKCQTFIILCICTSPPILARVTLSSATELSIVADLQADQPPELNGSRLQIAMRHGDAGDTTGTHGRMPGKHDAPAGAPTFKYQTISAAATR